MNYRSKADGLSEAIDRLRSELGVIKEELRVIDLRKPALESRATRIAEALSTLMGDGSTGDPRWMQLPRITEGGLQTSDDLAISPAAYAPRIPRSPKQKAGPLVKPEISEEAIEAMAEFIQSTGHSVKSSELYEHLLKVGKMAPIETEMPYKSFAITLRNIHQDLIEYSRATKTWSLRDLPPKAKLREALEKGDGSTRVVSSYSAPQNRDEHMFVKTVMGIFKENRYEALAGNRIFDELTDTREFGLIPGVSTLAEFSATLGSYRDFFPQDPNTGLFRAIRPEIPATRSETPVGAPGLYTVKPNGGVTV